MDDIINNIPAGVNSHKLYLIPEIKANACLPQFPISSSFLLQALMRGQNRKEHPTLDNSDPVKMLEIQLMFNKLNCMVNFNESFLSKYCLDGFLRVPLSEESVNVPEDL
jgi:hypothetical protein